MVFWEGYISDEMMGMIAPIAVCWVYGGAYQLLFLLQLSSSERFRLHTREEEEEKNLVQLPAVAKGVLLQQLFQAIVVHLLFFSNKGSVRLVQFFVVMYATDVWQYFIHRYMHENKFCHHLLIVPYAVGALYNHPLEELFVDTLGGAISFLVSEMTLRTAVYFCFSTIRTVDEHCSMLLPGNLFHIFFENSSAYHDIHRSLRRSKYNYSQPFSPFWGKVMGTHMPYTLVDRQGRRVSGFKARQSKKTS